MHRRRVSKGGNISPILEGDESIELGNKHFCWLSFINLSTQSIK